MLTPLYNAEAERLIWFTGSSPDAPLGEALAAIPAASDRGLDPTDYDAAALAEQWPAVKAGSASGPERALFDLTVSVAAARMLRGVHVGRVDPATMNWGLRHRGEAVRLCRRVQRRAAREGTERHARCA